MEIHPTAFIFSSLVTAAIVAFFYYVWWPFWGVNPAEIPPHLFYLYWAGWGWLGTFFTMISFWSAGRGRSRKGGR